MLVHAVALLLVLAFLRLGWWQVTRAAAGNILSFGYALEWPAFAAFVVFVWFKEVRASLRDGTPPLTVPRAERVRTERTREGPAYDDSDDERLAAYNRYLAWLNAHPQATPQDYPG
jgi:DNA-binding transcriptional regulator of glucitol operon